LRWRCGEGWEDFWWVAQCADTNAGEARNAYSVEVTVKIGMLWFDDDKHKKLEDKVLRAAAYYERKYGQAPNLCFVHPSIFNGNGKRGKQDAIKKAAGVEIRPDRSILLDHFWLGVAEERVRAGGGT
jgi:hypothetical protein